jgi:hypothetical protein
MWEKRRQGKWFDKFEVASCLLQADEIWICLIITPTYKLTHSPTQLLYRNRLRVIRFLQIR